MPYNYQGYLPLGGGLRSGVDLGLRILQLRDQRAQNKILQERDDTRWGWEQENQTLKLEDRERNIARQDAADGRAVEAHSMNMENSALQQHINQMNFQDKQDKHNLERIGAALNLSENFYNLVEGGDVNAPELLGALNGVFGEILGEGKQIYDLHDYKDEKTGLAGIMLELSGQPDAEHDAEWRAPMTVNRSSDPEDKVALLTYPQAFKAVETLNTKLKEAGFDMSTKEKRQQVYDTFHSLTGNDRAAKRAESKKGQEYAPDSNTKFIRSIMENILNADGTKMSFEQAADYALAYESRKTSSGKGDRAQEIRLWTNAILSQNSNLRSQQRVSFPAAQKQAEKIVDSLNETPEKPRTRRGSNDGLDVLRQHSANNVKNGGTVAMPDGKTASMRTASVNVSGKEVLIPTVWDGEILEIDDAIKRARAEAKKNNKSLTEYYPTFKTPEEATAASQALSEEVGKKGQQGFDAGGFLDEFGVNAPGWTPEDVQ